MQIEVKNLSFSYGHSPALENVSFSVEQGSLTAVVGANGAGKSTLFRCLLGFLKPKNGEIYLCGRKPRSEREFSKLAAYIPQSSEPVFNYSVLDMVLMGTTGALPVLQAPKDAQMETAMTALKNLGIDHLSHRGICQISGGERQLALIARALVQDAKILIMDEPTANLDFGNQLRVLEQISGLTEQGYTVLMSTHNPEHALHFASHVLALQKGRLCAFGKTEDTLTAELIQQLYGIPTKIVELDGNSRKYHSLITL